MKVIIDERERDLYSACDSIVSANGTYIQLSKEVLPLGDIFITTDEGKHVMLIERKSLRDLLASIKDGRYEEQSYRLMHSSGLPPHSILYMIEGSLSELRTPMEKRIVYSALTSLNYFKGFSTIRTMSVRETAEYIIWMSEKIERNFLKSVFPYYLQPPFCNFMQKPIVNIREPPIDLEETESLSGSQIISNINENVLNHRENILNHRENVLNHRENVLTPTSDNNTNLYVPTVQPEPANYCTVVKKVKKDNITPENIGEIILCQIPGISAVSAIAIMKKFSTFPNFMKEIKENPDCLNDIMCDTKGDINKSRKLGKNCIENLKRYFL
jgi:ERCC4-type nuclease